MYIFFLACAALGGLILILQIVTALVGAGDLDLEMELEEGLDLLSVRALAAGVAAFGLGGLATMELRLGWPLGLIVGAFLGTGAMLLTALLTRAMLRLEQSGTVRLEEAVGQAGYIHVAVPPQGEGAGRIQFELQGRTVEMKAISAASSIPTGSAVTIVSLVDGDTVEVVPTPSLKEIIG
jgi:hypothetical protein